MKKKILICDDDEIMQKLLGFFFRKENAEILPLLTGKDLLAVAKQQAPAVIILDMMLPDKDGLTALKELNGDPATAAIPVIILSATLRPEMISQARELGAKEFIEKPVQPARILEAVRKYTAD